MAQNKPLTIAALSSGVNSPSSRFRMSQYIVRLGRHGIQVREHIPCFGKGCGLPSPFKIAARIPALFKSRAADIVWVNRELVKGYETFERFLKRPRVMDVDDAIWLSRPFGRFAVRDIARAMDAIIAGNNYLADYFGQYCKNVYVVPTALDLDRYKLRPNLEDGPPKKFVIGWTGMSSNFKYLNTIEPVLERFMCNYENVEFMLIANRPWKFKLLPADRVSFIRWSKQNEATVLHSMSVGIMPLSDDEWTKGKCSFKMLQYMAVGLPVIVSPVGMNREVLEKADIGFAASSPDEWYEALVCLYNDDRSLQTKMGLDGRRVVEQFYNADIIAEKLAHIFRSVASG